MPNVHVARHLANQFPISSNCEIPGENISELISALEVRFPGVGHYILDDRGSLRKHVNIFIGNSFIKDRERLSDSVAENDDVYIMQALSGG